MLSTLLASLLFYYIQVPVADMHANPAKDAETISQAILAEEVAVVETQGDWVKIETTIDHFLGWIQKEELCHRKEEYASCNCIKPILEISQLSSPVFAQQGESTSPFLTLPFECRLEATDPFIDDSSWIKLKFPNEKEGYIHKDNVTFEIQMITKEQMVALSKRFLDLPFKSGGRSSFGFDHTGYIQMLYRQMGWLLPRTIEDQFNWTGFEAVSLEELEKGDLIFWGFSNQKLQHVGMYLGNHAFIHASDKEDPSCIKISHLDDPLYNQDSDWTYRVYRRLKS